MEEFEIPISVNGKEYLFSSRLIQFGYTYRIEVDVDGTLVNFEKDEERNWRALIDAQTEKSNINSDLVNAIIQVLDSL
jgi:hypothetical protein